MAAERHDPFHAGPYIDRKNLAYSRDSKRELDYLSVGANYKFVAGLHSYNYDPMGRYFE